METNYSVGDRVRLLIDSPVEQVVEATVRVVNDPEENPGKLIGLEFEYLTPRCNSLDGLVEERTDEARGITFGKGWWTRPENIERVTAPAA